MKKLIIFFTCLIISLGSFAQSKYWIFFRDRDKTAVRCIPGTAGSGDNAHNSAASRFCDWPVSAAYLAGLRKWHISPLRISKWLNAASAELNPEQLKVVRQLKFVQQVTPIRDTLYTAANKTLKNVPIENYAYVHTGGEWLTKASLTGRRVKIGIIDGGFLQADKNPNLAHLFRNGQVKSVRDFVTPGNKDFYNATYAYFGGHGTYVWQLIGGALANGAQYGAATDADYYLARTDDDNVESRREEDNWVAALEWMDSLGVRLINTSLGYSHDFDNARENYKPGQMNGHTTVVSRAAQIAIAKGMIIVAAAGNEGDNKDWRIIEAPADVKGVIAVGATDKGGKKLNFSSEGPDFLDYLKPDLSCYSGIGTSGSAPVITGLIACLLQESPHLSLTRVREILHRSGQLYPCGNNYLGYGVPDASKMISLLHNKPVPPDKTRPSGTPVLVKTHKDEVTLPNNQTGTVRILIFHKTDHWKVRSQEEREIKGTAYTIRRADREKHTTIILANQLTDIEWDK